MDSTDFQNRTKALGLQIIRLVEFFPQTHVSRVIANQLLRCGLSVGANYRAVCRAKSAKDFIHKMKIVEEECDETIYWLEIIVEANVMKLDVLIPLVAEGEEILAMVLASINTKNKNIQSSI